ncbi:hypothetical protein DSO57_1002657 [Entomophthora muscae]|uniref:Uncharacterized protein n=1 Tax=Entomophthora muscae TaxID=34485 RepID=A0ACC2TJN9_9FUNG|nr:hypothetical protein DSO57_1002657 [Entomophthora muscae]
MRLLFLLPYYPFLNQIEEVFGWIKNKVKKGLPQDTKNLFNILEISQFAMPPNVVAAFYEHSESFLPKALVWGFCPPVPKCVLDYSQGPAKRDCHSLKEDPLRNLLVYGPGGQGNLLIFQYLESSNNILDSLYLVLDFCTLVLDVCSLDLDSSAALRIQLLILGLLLRYLGLYQFN